MQLHAAPKTSAIERDLQKKHTNWVFFLASTCKSVVPLPKVNHAAAPNVVRLPKIVKTVSTKRQVTLVVSLLCAVDALAAPFISSLP